jgi:hypothetical protein
VALSHAFGAKTDPPRTLLSRRFGTTTFSRILPGAEIACTSLAPR